MFCGIVLTEFSSLVNELAYLRLFPSKIFSPRLKYCICIIQVSGNFELKRHSTLRKMSSDMKIDINTQFTPRQKKNVTYVSRMEVHTVNVHVDFTFA